MFILFMLVLPLNRISKGPSTPTQGSGTPTVETGALRFDNNINLLILAAGLGFAVMVTVKHWMKKQIVLHYS